jgi:hypothetical protein
VLSPDRHDPPQPVELTADPEFSERVVRLTITSAFGLAVIWFLSVVTVQPHPMVGWSLGLGWLLMPTILGVSLRWPRLRYALVVPSTLITIALLAICVTALPAGSRVISTGWLCITAGVLLGGLLGVWFWFRWLPVPAALFSPFSRGRWALIAVHVGLIVVGIGLLSFAATV